MDMRFLVLCGPGLEDLAVKELEQKIPKNITFSNPFGLRGYVQFEKNLIIEQIPEIIQQIKTLRCFERIGILLASQSIPEKIIDSQLHALFEETLDIVRTDPLLQSVIQGFQPNFSLLDYPICINAEEELQQKVQRIAKLIGKRMNLQIDHKMHKSKEGSEPLDIFFKQKQGNIFTYVRLPLHPGNFHLHRLHPTGLFPNFIYALSVLTCDAITTESQSDVILADPFLGTGGILTFIAKNWRILSQNDLGLRSLKLVGIEKNPQFYSQAESNMKDIVEKQLILDDFQKISLKSLKYGLCHAIITQPPYGFSIPQSEDTLRKLYYDFIIWAGNVLQPFGILSLITSQAEIFIEALDNAKKDVPEINWTSIHARTVQQHSIEVKIFILRKEIVLRKGTKKSKKKTE